MTDIHSIEDTTSELLATLPLFARIVASEVHQELGEEVTIPQFRVLAYLADGPQSLSALARHRRVSAQAIGELVQTLVVRGWVERSRDPQDRRQQLVSLTAAGFAHQARVQARMIQRLAPLLAELSPAEIDAIQTALPALRRVLCRSTTGESDVC